ncbi:MAG: four-carbon acid sugar kinase family protein, partial [Bacteroidota bacterium]
MSEKIAVKEFGNQIPALPEGDLREEIQARMRQRDCTVIVLDDDPTGTQTVHGISVLTEWSEEVIQKELEAKTPLFFIMTNSRSLVPQKAKELAIEIGQNIGAASRNTGRDTIIISRSDSTLRGHYPVEVEGLLQASGELDTIRFIIPAFFEGGRITFQDVHYVREKEQMIPAAQTPYAKDPVFGYTFSNLKNYVEEKTQGAVKASDVLSLSIEELRNSSDQELVQKLQGFTPGTTCIVNAAHPYDLQRFVIALLDSGLSAICRTAASFVSAMAALPDESVLFQSDAFSKSLSG